MNQKYLQGFSSHMMSDDESVFFEATPENITAFLYEHRTAEEALITNADGSKAFLSAQMGQIDICPDETFLTEKLNPIYIPVKAGKIPPPKLKTVPRKLAEAENGPMPDWNYLYWDGYSNEEFEGIISGKSLFDWRQDEDVYKIALKVASYEHGGNLAIEMIDWTDGEPELWDVLTVNLPEKIEQDCAFIDVNNLGDEILPWLEKNDLAKPTGRMMKSGYVEYPEYRFNAQKLQELSPQGYADYVKYLQS